MAFASFKISPDFVLSFTGLLDDLWYYQYHKQSYPKSAKIFMKQINLINALRLNPVLFNLTTYLTNPMVCSQQDKQMKKYLKLSSSDPPKVYFLRAGEDTYKNCLFTNLVMFLIMRIVVWIMDKIYMFINRNKIESKS